MDNSHIVLLGNSSALPNVFIIPGAGGLCNDYYELAAALKDQYSIYCLEMLGTRPDETPMGSMDELVRLNLAWIKQVQPSGVYRLIGHSFGAHTAFEVAMRLQEQGDQVAFTVILDEYAGLSDMLDDNAHINALKMTADYLRDFSIIPFPYPDWFLAIAEPLYDLPLKKIAAEVARKLKARLPEQSEDIDFTIRLINLRIYNAHISYLPSGVFHGELIVFRSVLNEESPEGAMGWMPYGECVTAVELSGGHGLTGNENAGIIANTILLKDKALQL